MSPGGPRRNFQAHDASPRFVQARARTFKVDTHALRRSWSALLRSSSARRRISSAAPRSKQLREIASQRVAISRMYSVSAIRHPRVASPIITAAQCGSLRASMRHDAGAMAQIMEPLRLDEVPTSILSYRLSDRRHWPSHGLTWISSGAGYPPACRIRTRQKATGAAGIAATRGPAIGGRTT